MIPEVRCRQGEQESEDILEDANTHTMGAKSTDVLSWDKGTEI